MIKSLQRPLRSSARPLSPFHPCHRRWGPAVRGTSRPAPSALPEQIRPLESPRSVQLRNSLPADRVQHQILPRLRTARIFTTLGKKQVPYAMRLAPFKRSRAIELRCGVDLPDATFAPAPLVERTPRRCRGPSAPRYHAFGTPPRPESLGNASWSTRRRPRPHLLAAVFLEISVSLYTGFAV